MLINKKVVAFKTICDSCKHEFETYDLSEFAYGERILLTEDGLNYAYIHCIESPAFREVSSMVDDVLGTNDKNWRFASKRTVCFNKVFGATCDKINSKLLDASRTKRRCPICGYDETSRWEFNPVKFVELELNEVTHVDWNQMEYAEKKEVVMSSLKLHGCL